MSGGGGAAHAPVDYGRWAGVGDSDSDSDSGAGAGPGSAPSPRVTRLGPGEAATFGSLRVRGAAAAAGGGPLREGRASGRGGGQGAARWGAQSGAVARLTRNGGRETTHLWSQDAEGATVAVLSPAGTRAREVQWELGARDLHLGEPVARRLRVVLRAPGAAGGAAPRVLVDAPLAYPVRAGEDDSDWELVDFEGDSEGRRLVVFSLCKAPPAAGVRVWWNRAFEGDAPVDTAGMEGRRGQPGAFSTAFKEAERQFRERLQSGGSG